MRLRFLQSLLNEIEAIPALTAKPKLFISFSKSTGDKYFQVAAQHATSFGFDVLDGFRRTGDVNVLGAVRNSIAEASAFLVIMTPELRISPTKARSPHGKRSIPPVRRPSHQPANSYAPSVWVVEEKGMALGLGKPFRMLVDKSVHQDYWLRTTPGHLHHVFDAATFEVHLDNALAALQRRYEEVLLAAVGVPTSGPEQ
jgi:hypothetical protein